VTGVKISEFMLKALGISTIILDPQRSVYYEVEQDEEEMKKMKDCGFNKLAGNHLKPVDNVWAAQWGIR